MKEGEKTIDNVRVAKNTLLLYARMLLLLFIGLYTSRIVLKELGVDNYGIFNVVAGFLSMFGIVTGSMSNAISRFVTVELGKGDMIRLKKVFSTSILVQSLMGILVIVLIESFGTWFLNVKLNIPEGREIAATWCLHCATITTILGLINVPFNSVIVAHEKMSAFAFMSILDAAFKLAICFAISISSFDKLITYAVLLVIVSIIINLIYWVYCLNHFEETKFKIIFDRELFKEIWEFAGWNIFGQSAFILNTQGVNMLMNIYFGVVVNAARGVASQVNGAIQSFVSNFMIALNPQITKSYASGDKNGAFELACSGCRFSFYIMFVLALPILIESHQILVIWLAIPPENSDIFVLWTILSTFTTILGNTLYTLQMAEGNIKYYQLWITLFGCLPFPMSWVAFKLEFPAISSYILFFIVYWALIFVRFYLVNRTTGITARMYLVGVVLRTHVVGLISAIVPFFLFCSMEESLIRLLLVCATSVLSSLIFIFFLGLDTKERNFLIKRIQKLIK